jgi:RNA polymerase sigma-70 factor (ECF subfamily)
MESALHRICGCGRTVVPEDRTTGVSGARGHSQFRAHRRLVSTKRSVPPEDTWVYQLLRGIAAGLAQRRCEGKRRRPLDALSDTELLANYLAAEGKAGSGVWIQELFRRHYAKVVGWCLRMAGDREEAYDLAQAIFVKAYRHLNSFRGQSKISTWLYSITRSECMNYLKARSIRPALQEADRLDELPDAGAASPDHALEREASARVVHALLDQTLDETEKKVFTLHYGDDMPLDAITRLLGLSNRSGAKAYIVAARRKLSRAVRLLKMREGTFDA